MLRGSLQNALFPNQVVFSKANTISSRERGCPHTWQGGHLTRTTDVPSEEFLALRDWVTAKLNKHTLGDIWLRKAMGFPLLLGWKRLVYHNSMRRWGLSLWLRVLIPLSLWKMQVFCSAAESMESISLCSTWVSYVWRGTFLAVFLFLLFKEAFLTV